MQLLPKKKKENVTLGNFLLFASSFITFIVCMVFCFSFIHFLLYFSLIWFPLHYVVSFSTEVHFTADFATDLLKQKHAIIILMWFLLNFIFLLLQENVCMFVHVCMYIKFLRQLLDVVI